MGDQRFGFFFVMYMFCKLEGFVTLCVSSYLLRRYVYGIGERLPPPVLVGVGGQRLPERGHALGRAEVEDDALAGGRGQLGGVGARAEAHAGAALVEEALARQALLATLAAGAVLAR